MDKEKLIDSIRTECWNKALDCCGFSYIFSRRRRRINPKQLIITLLGFILPVFFGTFILNLNEESSVEIMKVIFLILGLVQLLFSAVSVIWQYNSKIESYSKLLTEFSILEVEFEQLAKFPLGNYTNYNIKYSLIMGRMKGLSSSLLDLKDKEKRMGMCYGLRQYRRSCAGCKKTPLSMKPTKCGVCGNF